MTDPIERTKNGADALIDRARDAVVNATVRAEQGVETAAGRVVEQSHGAGESVRGGAETASRNAHRRVEGAAQAIDRGYARARGDLTRAATAATDFVTENPGKSLMLAAAAGLACGLWLRRRQAGAPYSKPWSSA